MSNSAFKNKPFCTLPTHKNTKTEEIITFAVVVMFKSFKLVMDTNIETICE
jgi:hypothetical protein